MDIKRVLMNLLKKYLKILSINRKKTDSKYGKQTKFKTQSVTHLRQNFNYFHFLFKVWKP